MATRNKKIKPTTQARPSAKPIEEVEKELRIMIRAKVGEEGDFIIDLDQIKDALADKLAENGHTATFPRQNYIGGKIHLWSDAV